MEDEALTFYARHLSTLLFLPRGNDYGARGECRSQDISNRRSALYWRCWSTLNVKIRNSVGFEERRAAKEREKMRERERERERRGEERKRVRG